LLHGAAVQPEDDLLELNCGRCGKKILVWVEEVRELRMIDCLECSRKREREAKATTLFPH
jgi:DNA-directed RNA polymerase subunit RPC12/RpoP